MCKVEIKLHQRVDAFKLLCWRRLLRVPWTARRSNQSILKEISPEYSLEGLMLKLKLQYFVHLIGRTDSLEKTLMLGKIEDGGWRGWQRMRWLDDIADLMDMSLNKLRCAWWTGKPGSAAVHGVANSWICLSNWTALKQIVCASFGEDYSPDSMPLCGQVFPRIGNFHQIRSSIPARVTAQT